MSFFHNSYNSNLLRSCSFLLEQYGITHTKKYLKELLENHNDDLSFLSIIDIVSEYGIESGAVHKGKSSYSDFDTPFICSIQQQNWPQAYFTVVTYCEGDKIIYLSPNSNKLKESSLLEFEKIDKEVILLFDDTHKKEEKNYKDNKEKEKNEALRSIIPIIFLGIIFLKSLITQVSATYYLPYSWPAPVFLTTSGIGLLIAFLLLLHDVDSYNPFFKEVCGGGLGKSKLNCNAVLSSSGSYFLGISWSIWGFSYFSTFFICQIIFSSSIPYLFLWAILSLVMVIFIPYSLYYQYKIVKQWCPLCLAILSVLVTNTVISSIFLTQQSKSLFNWQTLFNVFTIGLGLLLFTYYAIPLLKKSIESKKYKNLWHQQRFNPDIFYALLVKRNQITVPVDGLGIVVGNPSATNEIIKVCNPYCGPCASAHLELEQLINKSTDVRLRVIFTASGEVNDRRTAPVAHLLSMQDKLDKQTVQKALDYWYRDPMKDYEAFAKKYPIKGELTPQKSKIYAMRNWCNEMDIRATPTIFINGYELPEGYRIDELKNFF